MALVLADRVQVSTSTTGTGTLTLGSALDGFQDFSVIGDGNTTYYTITNGNNWEVGIGTYTASGTTLSRDTILDSSNSGSAINLSGTSNVFVTYPADKNVNADDIGSTVQAYDADTTKNTATQTLTNKTLESAILNNGYTEEVYAISDGATVNLDPNNGSIQTWTLGASRTPNQANWAAGQAITLMIDDGSAYTVTWTTLAVVWTGGAAPTLATSGYTVVELWKVGTTIYGALVGEVA